MLQFSVNTLPFAWEAAGEGSDISLVLTVSPGHQLLAKGRTALVTCSHSCAPEQVKPKSVLQAPSKPDWDCRHFKGACLGMGGQLKFKCGDERVLLSVVSFTICYVHLINSLENMYGLIGCLKM